MAAVFVILLEYSILIKIRLFPLLKKQKTIIHINPNFEIKRNTQKIERENLNLRTWIKRLTRRTICFSKKENMHDTVIGLLINKVKFGVVIHAQPQV